MSRISPGLFDSIHEEAANQADALQANLTLYDLGFDPDAWASEISATYKIEEKKSRLIRPWGPLLRDNFPQKRLLLALLKAMERGGPMRMLVLKGRRVGASTGIILWVLGVLMRVPWKAKIIAHSDASAETLLSIARTAYQHMPIMDKPPLQKDNVGELRWGEPKKANRNAGILGHESLLTANTAKGAFIGSGGGLSILVLSEAAKYSTVGDINAQMRFILSVMQSVPKIGPSAVIAESTANGAVGWFYETWMRAAKKTPDQDGNTWIPHFISSLDDHDCQMEPPPRYDWGLWPSEDKDREQLMKHLNATPEQMYFRRWTIENEMNFDFDAYDQEYPVTPDLAFKSSGRTAFPKRLLDAQRVNLRAPIAAYDTAIIGGERWSPYERS